MRETFMRTELVIGTDNMKKLQNSKILIVGIGGVGSYSAESLARSNIGSIDIIDNDIVDITNINRQIIALHSTIGKSKVEMMKNRIMDINPDCNINAMDIFLDENNIENILDNGYDYVVDAIDSFNSKIALIIKCKERNIRCISAMGMGNKVDPTKIKVSDIYKTEMCKLAKKVRKTLKENDIKKHKVVFSTEESVSNDEHIIGSTSFVPAVAGLVIASEVVKDLIKSE